MISVEIHSDGRINRRDLDAARRAMAGLDRYDAPMPLSAACAEMHLYLRGDGDYGLVGAA